MIFKLSISDFTNVPFAILSNIPTRSSALLYASEDKRAMSAPVACMSNNFFDNTSLQVGIFVVVSFIALLLTKKIVNKVKNKQIIPTNLDRVIGKIGIVTETISPLKIGEVKVDGKRWSAVSDTEIKLNEKVKILAIDGVKLKCQRVEEKN